MERRRLNVAIDEKIEWLEKRTVENLKFRLQVRETLAKEANNLLAILLAVTFAINNFREERITLLLMGSSPWQGADVGCNSFSVEVRYHVNQEAPVQSVRISIDLEVESKCCRNVAEPMLFHDIFPALRRILKTTKPL